MIERLALEVAVALAEEDTAPPPLLPMMVEKLAPAAESTERMDEAAAPVATVVVGPRVMMLWVDVVVDVVVAAVALGEPEGAAATVTVTVAAVDVAVTVTVAAGVDVAAGASVMVLFAAGVEVAAGAVAEELSAPPSVSHVSSPSSLAPVLDTAMSPEAPVALIAERTSRSLVHFTLTPVSLTSGTAKQESEGRQPFVCHLSFTQVASLPPIHAASPVLHDESDERVLYCALRFCAVWPFLRSVAASRVARGATGAADTKVVAKASKK